MNSFDSTNDFDSPSESSWQKNNVAEKKKQKKYKIKKTREIEVYEQNKIAFKKKQTRLEINSEIDKMSIVQVGFISLNMIFKFKFCFLIKPRIRIKLKKWNLIVMMKNLFVQIMKNMSF